MVRLHAEVVGLELVMQRWFLYRVLVLVPVLCNHVDIPKDKTSVQGVYNNLRRLPQYHDRK